MLFHAIPLFHARVLIIAQFLGAVEVDPGAVPVATLLRSANPMEAVVTSETDTLYSRLVRLAGNEGRLSTPVETSGSIPLW